MTLKYGTATFEELPRIVEMKLAMFREAGKIHLLANNANAIVLKDYQHIYGEDKGKHFVARIEENIIASVGGFIKSDLPFRYYSSESYGFIGDVYTEPEYRGKGISTELNKMTLEWLQKKGVRMVRLLASDIARPIYEKLGFTASDEMILTIKK